jgi:hypothetical protein
MSSDERNRSIEHQTLTIKHLAYRDYAELSIKTVDCLLDACTITVISYLYIIVTVTMKQVRAQWATVTMKKVRAQWHFQWHCKSYFQQ